MALIYFSLDSRSVIDITPYSEVTDTKKPGPGPNLYPVSSKSYSHEIAGHFEGSHTRCGFNADLSGMTGW